MRRDQQLSLHSLNFSNPLHPLRSRSLMSAKRRFGTNSGTTFLCIVLPFTLAAQVSSDTTPQRTDGATVAANASNQLDPADRELVETVAKFASGQAEQDKFSGVVLIGLKGQALFEQAYGFADREKKEPNTARTRFNIASVGKMFTGASAAKLVEQGKLSYDEKLGRYLPDFPIEDARNKVTIHHLLTHTSGLGEHITPEFIKAGPTRLADYHPFLVTKLEFEPGTKRAYSNAAFAVMGLIIEKVSGMEYFEFVKKELFAPAGMIETEYVDKTDTTAKNIAIGYTKEPASDSASPTPSPDVGSKPESAVLRPNDEFLVRKGDPAGGAFSTAHDLLLFLEALRTHKLLSAESTKTMITPRSGTQSAYGIAQLEVGNDRLVGHSGGTEGASADAYIYWNSGYAIVVLSNLDPPASHEIARMGRKLFEERFK